MCHQFNRSFSILIVILISCFFLAHANVAVAINQNLRGVKTVGGRYILTCEVDLEGGELILPQGVVLDCRKGILKNGSIKGCGNRVLYAKPFIGDNLSIDGCYVNDKKILSSSILVKNRFSDADIQNIYGLARNGAVVVFEYGVYNNVMTININKDIKLDFSNSFLKTAIDQYGLSSPVFMTESEPSRRYNRVIIQNVTIDGQRPYPENADATGPRRNAIRLMNVKDVSLKNVSIKNFGHGIGGYYAKDVKKRYMEGVCNITDYEKCSIQNCFLSNNTGEGFYLVPGESTDNFTLFKRNRSINNPGTLLTLVDGRCLVEGNEMDGFGYSGMNVFCYNSIIRNNFFKRGERFNCIDITENGLYWPKNVKIYNNEADDCVGFIMVAGENVTVERNRCTNPRSAFALTIFGYMPSDENSNAYINQRLQGGGQTSIDIKNNEWICKGGIATYKGCQGSIKVESNTIAVVPNEEGKPYRGSALELNDCRFIKIENNFFNDSFRNAMLNSNVYITVNECSGDVIINNNNFNRTVSTSDHATLFLYTQKSSIENLTLEGNKSTIIGISSRNAEGELVVRGVKKARNNEGVDTKGVIND